MLPDLFRIFHQGATWLWTYPLWTLALLALGLLLDALAPWIQIRAGLPDHLLASQSLMGATTLPLTLYALPRFVLFLDAEALDSPLNPRSKWQDTFELRWLRLLGAKVLVSTGVLIGLFALVIPGLMLLAAFGWAPTLVLTRGFTLKKALQGSLRIMAQHAPKVIFSFLGIFLVVLLVSLGATALLPMAEKDLTPLFRLRSPHVWAMNALGTLSTIWLSAALLALFHRVEGPAGETAEAEPDGEE
jgi:hypothetical protein